MQLSKFCQIANIEYAKVIESLKENGCDVTNTSVIINFFNYQKLKQLKAICEEVHDYRCNSGRFKHELSNIIFMTILAIICMSKNLMQVCEYIKSQYANFIDILYPLDEYPDRDEKEKFSEYRKGPSYTTLERCLGDTEPDDLCKCFDLWRKSIGLDQSSENKIKNYKIGSDLNKDIVVSSISESTKIIEIRENDGSTEDNNFENSQVLDDQKNITNLNIDPTHDSVHPNAVYPSNNIIQDEELTENAASSRENIKEVNHIALDGKAIRGSACPSQNKRPSIIVTAYNVDDGSILANEEVEVKTNEITANKNILGNINVEGLFFSWDALGTQRTLVDLVHNGGGFYVAQVKSNQKILEEVCSIRLGLYAPVPYLKIIEYNRDRIETREYFLTNNVLGMEELNWSGLTSIGKVVKTTEKNGKKTTETHIYITNFYDENLFVKITRGHWGIENKLHWVLDNIFNEDKCKCRKYNLPFNLNLFRKFAISFLNFGKKLLTDGAKSIENIGRILDRKPNIIEKICLGEKFSLREEFLK